MIKGLLKLVGLFIVLLVVFQIHIVLGIGVVVSLLGYLFYRNRSGFYAQRGNIAYMKGDMAQALRLLEKAYHIKPANPKHQIGYGYLLLKSGEPQQAEAIFKEVMPKAKSREDVLGVQLNLATSYWLQGRKDEAYEMLKQLFAEYKNTLLYGNLGYFMVLRGELEEALVFNQEAYTYNDNDVTIMDNLAQNYYLLGRYEEAEAMYDKVMAKTPKYAESYYYYALTLRQLGKVDEAREQIEQAQGKPLALITALKPEAVKQLAEELRLPE